MNKKKITTYSLAAVGLFFAINYGWTQAAMAKLVSPATCPVGLIEQSKQRAGQIFPKVQSAPVVLCFESPVLGIDVSHGTTRFAPLLPAIIILGSKGMNEDVAGHEYVHAELASRTSVLLRSYKIPTWFDEGLAMQVDHRSDYSDKFLATYLDEGTLAAPSLSQLSSPRGFFTKGDIGKANYAFAKCVVGHWLDAHPNDGLDDLIDAVGWLDPFDASAFEAFLETCLKR